MAKGLVEGGGFATDASLIKAGAQRQHSCPGNAGITWAGPEQASRPVREYLAALERANPVPPAPEKISLTDPASTWTAAAGPAIFAYSTNYLIDLKAGLIVDVEASAVNKTAEVEATKIMIERVEEKFAIKPRRLVGDTNYGVATMLEWLVNEKRISPHVPVWNKSEHYDGTFSRTEFFFDAGNNRYVCPAGKYLRPPQRGQVKTILRYRASVYDCRVCDPAMRNFFQAHWKIILALILLILVAVLVLYPGPASAALTSALAEEHLLQIVEETLA